MAMSREPAGLTDVPPIDNGATPDLPNLVGWKLRRLRTQRGYSLDRLAKLSGVSRGMLGQIELAKSMPTIGVLWKIATALNVPFAALITADASSSTVVLRRDRAKVLGSSEGRFLSRALFPFDVERRVEFYELRIAPDHEEAAEGHASGTTENLVVTSGALELFDGVHWHRLAEGDAILFDASAPHIYRNLSDSETVIYLVMTYVEVVG